MKKWVLIDWRKDDLETETALEAKTREEALAEARTKWRKLSRHDQKNRADFYVAFVEVDEEGCADLDSESGYISMEEITQEEDYSTIIEDE